MQVLVGEETYTFELTSLREVCPINGLTRIPCSAGFIVGVINLRGRVIPILDLLDFLELASDCRVPLFAGFPVLVRQLGRRG